MIKLLAESTLFYNDFYIDFIKEYSLVFKSILIPKLANMFSLYVSRINDIRKTLTNVNRKFSIIRIWNLCGRFIIIKQFLI